MSNEVANEEKRQRLIGSLQSAAEMLKHCEREMPFEQRRALDLLQVSAQALGKSILALWEQRS